jgi:cytochrome c-type biogenesis protein CcmH/NrfG
MRKPRKTLASCCTTKRCSTGRIDAYRAAIAIDPAIKGVYKHFAEILMAQGGDQTEIVTALTGAIAAGEAEASVYGALGTHYYKRGNCVKAVEMFQKALQLDPKNIPRLSFLGRLPGKKRGCKRGDHFL